MNRYALYFLLALLAATTGTRAAKSLEHRPQWQGPDRNAVSQEAGLLQEWPEDGPPLAWRIDGLGGGDSAPSIAEGRIFGMSNRGDEEVVWALSESDGEELWVTPLGPALQQSNFHNRRRVPDALPRWMATVSMS